MLKKITRGIKKWLWPLGYRPKIIKNVFNTKFTRRALISYITEPFICGIKKTHTNVMECYTAAEVFHELGYRVDVIGFKRKGHITYDNYDVVYGFGNTLEKSFYSDCAEKIKKIYYSTGACAFYWNKRTVLKVLEFQKEKGKIIPQAARMAKRFWPLQFIMPDLNVCLGNQFMADTYLEINPNINIRTLNNFYYDVYDIDLSQKNFKEARKHFLWFGSSGTLHKGLDILIDIFSQRDDVFLHICGASKKEKKFFDYYQPIIDKSNNIVDHGFVNVDTDDFRKIMDQCAFVLFPSVAEGQPGSVITVMANGGLIPVISTSCGLDVEEYGYVFEDIAKNVVLDKIDEILKLTEEELYAKSLKAKTNVRKNYSHQNYKQNLLKILGEFCGQ
ncbi:MAG: glycosyltransferase family 4 protein [Chitinispirillales bacterium]|nr:glycosyltransferase family 4 protein [Chitinispirillales bacterium]